MLFNEDNVNGTEKTCEAYAVRQLWNSRGSYADCVCPPDRRYDDFYRYICSQHTLLDRRTRLQPGRLDALTGNRYGDLFHRDPFGLPHNGRNTKDVLPYTIVAGVPAKVIGKRERKGYQYGYHFKDDTSHLY